MAVIHAPSSAVVAAPLATPAAPTLPPISLLLFEPQFLVRRTVAAVARDMRLAHPHETTTLEHATRELSVRAYDALFLSLDEVDLALALLQRVRQGETKCAADVPVAVTAGACDTALALRLKGLDVRRLVLRPFKVKGVLDAIVALRPSPPLAMLLPRAA